MRTPPEVRRGGIDVWFTAPAVFTGELDPAHRCRSHQCSPALGYEERADGLAAGVYLGSWWFFNAGSIRSYARWREWLSRTAIGADLDRVWSSPASFQGAPFLELLDFDDAGGLIGPRTSAKLAADFETFRSRLPARTDRGLLENYNRFTRAFAAGASGLVLIKERDDTCPQYDYSRKRGEGEQRDEGTRGARARSRRAPAAQLQ